MRGRSRLLLVAPVCLGSLVLGLMLGRPSTSTAQAPAPSARTGLPGRYQISAGGIGTPYLVLIDTTTGRCWWRATPQSRGGWQEVEPPGGLR